MGEELRRQKILIVDDIPSNITILSEMFRNEYEIASTTDSEQAMELAASGQPDIILLDIMMPVMDGYEVCKRLKEDVRTQDIPVIFVTAKLEEEDELKGFEVGGVDYITKPFSINITKARVKTHLQKQLRRQEKNRSNGRIMAGNLSDIGLMELLQSMELGGKTAKIKLKDIDGEIYLRNGCCVGARQGEHTGDTAFTRLLLMEEGEFTATFETLPSDKVGQTCSLTSMLAIVLAHLELAIDKQIIDHPRRPALIKKLKGALRRVEPYQRSEGLMKGDLSDISLVELLQNMEQGAKTAAVFLSDIEGEIYIQDGGLIHIQQANFTGDKALTRIFLLERGAFTVEFEELPAKITQKPEPLMTVLMNTLAYVDDVRDRLKTIQAEKLLLHLNIPQTGFEAIDAHAAEFPISFSDLLVLMDGDLKKNFNLLLHVIRSHKIRAKKVKKKGK